MKTKNILISGGGVAGLTVAYWLQKYGFTPTLIERSQTLRSGGYKIDIRGTALEVIERMHLRSKILDAKTDMQGATVIDKYGNTIAEMSADTFGFRTGDDLEIMRGDLIQILQKEVHGVESIFEG